MIFLIIDFPECQIQYCISWPASQRPAAILLLCVGGKHYMYCVDRVREFELLMIEIATTRHGTPSIDRSGHSPAGSAVRRCKCSTKTVRMCVYTVCGRS